jgi:hypothetical protein
MASEETDVGKVIFDDAALRCRRKRKDDDKLSFAGATTTHHQIVPVPLISSTANMMRGRICNSKPEDIRIRESLL